MDQEVSEFVCTSFVLRPLYLLRIFVHIPVLDDVNGWLVTSMLIDYYLGVAFAEKEESPLSQFHARCA